jgi:hypothetical protein
LKRKIMISLSRGKKEGKQNGNLVIVLKEWGWVMIVLEGWNFRKISQTLSGFIA